MDDRFEVKIAPTAMWDANKWKMIVYLDYGIGTREPFAHVFGKTKEIAAMRAQLVVDAINKGAKP